MVLQKPWEKRDTNREIALLKHFSTSATSFQVYTFAFDPVAQTQKEESQATKKNLCSE